MNRISCKCYDRVWGGRAWYELYQAMNSSRLHRLNLVDYYAGMFPEPHEVRP